MKFQCKSHSKVRMNYIIQLTNAIHSAIPLLQKIADGQPSSFDKA